MICITGDTFLNPTSSGWMCESWSFVKSEIVQMLNPNRLWKRTLNTGMQESIKSPMTPTAGRRRLEKGSGGLWGCKYDGADVGQVIAVVMAANLKAPTRLPPVAASMQKQRRPRRVMTQTNPLPLTRNGGCYSPPTRAQSARQPIPHALHSLSSSSSLPPRPRLFLHLCPATSPNFQTQAPQRWTDTALWAGGVGGTSAHGRACTHRRRDYSRWAKEAGRRTGAD